MRLCVCTALSQPVSAFHCIICRCMWVYVWRHFPTGLCLSLVLFVVPVSVCSIVPVKPPYLFLCFPGCFLLFDVCVCLYVAFLTSLCLCLFVVSVSMYSIVFVKTPIHGFLSVGALCYVICLCVCVRVCVCVCLCVCVCVCVCVH